jgi:hypothetical protein
MRRSFTKIYSRTLLLAVAMLMSFSMVANSKFQKIDSTYLHYSRLNKKDKNYLKGIKVNMPVIKPYPVSVTKAVAPADDKVLSNVQIFPNPVTDQINIKYSLSHNANVTIKIMDVLGNEVVTLFSQRVEPGEQKFTRSMTNKLQSGFYFVRIIVGTESIIRRISIL